MFKRLFIFYADNCKCAGIPNTYGDGSICKPYKGYTQDFLNDIWCIAETDTCKEASEHGLHYGHYGPSQKACLNIDGRIYNIYENMLSLKLKCWL